MAGHEDEPQEVVAHVVVLRSVALGDRQVLLDLQLASDLVVLALLERPPAEEVDRASPGDGHEPGPRVVRDA